MCNIRKIGSESAWYKRHGREYDGLQYPFGALVQFLPPKPILKELPKFAPRAIDGLFVGYFLAPGAHFRGEYLIIALEDLSKTKPTIHRVKEVVIPRGSISFPAVSKPTLLSSASSSSFAVSNHELYDQGGWSFERW
jgi:hypothetical protein